VRYFGLAMAGAVSGALHDLEGERGVWVASRAHPAPFQAFGDNLLDDPRNATNHAQAVLAVTAAREELNVAYSIGEQEAAASGVTAAELPSVVHFAFDSSELTAADRILLAMGGAYLARNPDTGVDLTGHTDPVGTPEYNTALGMRRAEAVATVLLSGGARITQVQTASRGEEQLVTEDPKQFNLDRRTVLTWRTQASPRASTSAARWTARAERWRAPSGRPTGRSRTWCRVRSRSGA
jgi:peptidoglycan-associated lipoprotein